VKIPSEVLVKGKLWTVEYKWGLRDGGEIVDGLCQYGPRKILIRRELKKEDKPAVFLHELIHAILFESHLNEDGGLDGFAEEVVCSSIADVILTLFHLRLKRRA
jgi:hypothetical protein